jgi:hypothetical protein
MIDHAAQRSLNALLAVAVVALVQGRCLTGVDWVDEVVFPEDYAVYQKEEAEAAQRRQEYQAEQARQRAQQQAEAAVPQGEFGPPINAGAPAVHPPVINSISFPDSIPGNHTNIDGEMSFSDAGGDVNRATMTVVHSSGDFAGTDWDPSPYLLSGSAYAGSYYFYVWCEGQQSVTLKLTLYDAAGVASAGKDFSFSCT